MTVASLPSERVYSGSHLSARWHGHKVADKNHFNSYMANRVKARVKDDEASDFLEAELRAIDTTDMTSEFVEKTLRSVPEEKPWAIGEALAECVLSDDDEREIYWPWNPARDRRTPKASLPGADLIGFCKERDAVFLLFGEVKTSSDKNTPPSVMRGSRGITAQLKKIANNRKIRCTLLKWLCVRCKSDEHLELYRAAVRRYVESQGKEILLVGVLLRDTKSDERDIISQAKGLAENLDLQTRVEVTAWYLPVLIKDWPALLYGGTP